MKVSLYNSIEISDEQRVQLARLLDGPDAKKRQATRDEIKDFAWTWGAAWDTQLRLVSAYGSEAALGDEIISASQLDEEMAARISDPGTELDDLLGLSEPEPSLEDLL